MPIFIEENTDPRTTGTYEPDRIPQGFKAPVRFGRMRPNRYAGVKVGGGYDAPRGTPTWTPTWDQTSGITNSNLINPGNNNEVAQTRWKNNIPLMLRSLRQRDEFKDWSDDELTHYMHRTFSNRGGLMSLV